MTQLEHVAEQDKAVRVAENLQQGCAQLSPAQQVRARDTTQVQVGDD